MKCAMLSTGSLALFALTATSVLAHPSMPKRAPSLVMGAAKSYGAVASSTLTSTGDTVITGDCGTYPGTAITGFPPGVITGHTSSAGIPAHDAQDACLSAYTAASALTPTVTLPADLGGRTLKPGVYTFDEAGAANSGTLTLDGAGQFVFLIESTLTTAEDSKVVLRNGAQACNVYFVVGSSATIGEGSQMQGNILAYASISMSEAASNKGTFCALNGAVTLINNALTAQTVCSA